MFTVSLSSPCSGGGQPRPAHPEPGQRGELDDRVAAEQARYEELRLEVAQLESPQRISTEAQQTLGMVARGRGVADPDEPARGEPEDSRVARHQRRAGQAVPRGQPMTGRSGSQPPPVEPFRRSATTTATATRTGSATRTRRSPGTAKTAKGKGPSRRHDARPGGAALPGVRAPCPDHPVG
jgi:hypothetical protein